MKPRTKLEGLTDMVKCIFGKEVKVESTDCGQRYYIRDPHQGYFGIVYIDPLKRGRVSIKIKHCPTIEPYRLSKAMWNWLYYFSDLTVDAASKADVYGALLPWGDSRGAPLIPRLRCDKWW